MITLQLHDIDSTHGMLDILYNNGYKYVNNYSLSLDTIKNDIVNVFKFPGNRRDGYAIYFIEIHKEEKVFGLHSKWADINYIRNQKLKQLNLW